MDKPDRQSSSSSSSSVSSPVSPPTLASRPLPPWPISPSSSYASPKPHNRRDCPGAPIKEQKSKSRILAGKVPDEEEDGGRPINLLPKRRLIFDTIADEVVPTRHIISPNRQGNKGMGMGTTRTGESTDSENDGIRPDEINSKNEKRESKV